MRICGGNFKGRKLNPPAKNWPTRPTTDRARESLYNILTNRFDFSEIRMLDLFSGTGAQGIECISRGCCDVTAVDKHWPAVKFQKRTASEWGFEDCIEIIKMDAGKFIRSHTGKPFDYIFAGPPYPLPWLDEIPERVSGSNLIADQTLLVLEHNANHDFSDSMEFVEKRNYGDTIFSLFDF